MGETNDRQSRQTLKRFLIIFFYYAPMLFYGIHQNNTQNEQTPTIEFLQGQQGVIQRSQRGAGQDDYGQLKADHYIEHGLLTGQGNQDSACAFDN